MHAPRPELGRRILVTGLAGSGKSTFARALAAELDVPVIVLDLEFWKPGWVAPSDAEWRDTQRAVLAADEWIAEGNYAETLDLRLEHADSIVVLDLPWWVCSVRALRRGFHLPDRLPAGCDYPRWKRWRDEWQLAGRVWRRRRAEPEHERSIIARHGSHVVCVVLRSRREVAEFLVEFGHQPYRK